MSALVIASVVLFSGSFALEREESKKEGFPDSPPPIIPPPEDPPSEVYKLFYGTWTNGSTVLVFNEDGTMDSTDSEKVGAKWGLDKTTLIITNKGLESLKLCFEYSFSNDNNTLTLTPLGKTGSIELTKAGGSILI